MNYPLPSNDNSYNELGEEITQNEAHDDEEAKHGGGTFHF